MSFLSLIICVMIRMSKMSTQFHHLIAIVCVLVFGMQDYMNCQEVPVCAYLSYPFLSKFLIYNFTGALLLGTLDKTTPDCRASSMQIYWPSLVYVASTIISILDFLANLDPNLNLSELSVALLALLTFSAAYCLRFNRLSIDRETVIITMLIIKDTRKLFAVSMKKNRQNLNCWWDHFSTITILCLQMI